MRSIHPVRSWAALAGLWLSILSAAAQNFNGLNAPGSAAEFSFEVDAETTNFSVRLSGGSEGYSHLYLKRGGPPSEGNYDFASRLNGQANAIHLELPEVAAGTYFARVETPASAPSHAFSLAVEMNVPDMRSLERPVSKPVGAQWTGTISASGRQYFRFDLATNTPFRLSLDSANIPPDLYVQRDQAPVESSYWKRSLNVANDSLVAIENESLPGAYFVGVFVNSSAPPNAPFAMKLEGNPIHALAWDPGTTPEGTLVSSNYSTVAGEQFFKVATANPSVGAWRTALRVLEGEAAVYMSRGSLPSVTQADYKSERIGSDGFVLSSSQFAPNEVWYILVRTAPNTRWTLVSGTPFVQDLGTVSAESPGSGDVAIGPEGIRFFSARVPAGMLAWRVWLNGATNQILFKKASVPLSGFSELSQAAQVLVVPPYLASGQKYFMAVPGQPDTPIRLESKAQPIIDLPYGSSTVSNITGFPYTTYKVQVPPQQIAWQISLPSNSGNPNVAVRRSTVPNENYNDALSDLEAGATDNISLVPPVLSDGAFYVTVWGAGAHQFTLHNGPAVVTDIDYLDTVTNDDPSRAGWRFYRVANIAQQLGSLGWQLDLANGAPGTRLAIRRNAAPSLWSQRNPGLSTASYHEMISAGQQLQQPGHQADVWYIGVYNPTNVLGQFTLTTSEIAAVKSQVGDTFSRVNCPPGEWSFLSFELSGSGWAEGGGGVAIGAPGGSYVLGWDLRLVDVVGSPVIVVRRDALPDSLNTSFTLPVNATTWPSRGQWAANLDWTARPLPPLGTTNENGRILTMPFGRPFEPGNYYVGIINHPSQPVPTSFKFIARSIGPGQEIPVHALERSGGQASGSVDPREADYYMIEVPEGQRSLRIRLRVTSGEAMMVASRGALPNVTALGTSPVVNSAGRAVQKIGDEYLTILPPRETNVLSPGTYYVAVVGEGQAPAEANRIGTGPSSYLLETLGELPEIDLGPLGPMDISTTGNLAGGEVLAYHFAPDTNVLGFWISLTDIVGNPIAVSRGGPELADAGVASPPLSADPYGNDGGETESSVAGPLLTIGDPFDIETIMVKARQSGPPGTYPNASYRLNVEQIQPRPLDFDGGTVTISDQSPARGGYYVVDVPESAIGWDIRLSNVTSGKPQIVVGKEALPVFLNTTATFAPATATEWKDRERWVATRDWTERAVNSDGVNVDGRTLTMGMGRPLKPGRYYIAVLGATTEAPMSYTLTSRGIGAGFTIPVTPLAFEGGSLPITGLAPRDAAYFSVEIPENTPSWKAHLTVRAGEGMMAIGKGTIPNVLVAGNGSLTNSSGRKVQKLGDEHFLLLPPAGTNVLSPGTYYLAVVAEGNSPQAGRTGSGNSDFTIVSQGPAPVRDLGQISAADLTEAGTLAAGDTQLYRFTVPVGTLGMGIRLDQRTGNPAMVLKGGPLMPAPGLGQATLPLDTYGYDGGVTTGHDAHPSFINVGNPTNETYSLVVMARSLAGGAPTNATYTLRLNASGSGILPFDGESVAVADQGPQSWRYFSVVVPENAVGWDVRLRDVTGGLPKLVIRRESLPSSLQTTPWSSPSTQTAWPTNAQWAPGPDWTRRSASSADAGISEDGRIFACGMGRPLQPGTYYVGVYNNSPTAKSSYTIISRGIGEGFAIPVVDVPMVGAAEATLPAREAAYFRVVVPTNTLSWKVKLTGTAGESMMVAARGFIPSLDMNVAAGTLAAGKGMQKLGHDHFLLLPGATQTNVTSGTNYFAVVSEGVNPPNASRIGSGSSSFTFESQGSVVPEDLGLLTSEDIVQAGQVEGGESRLYQFLVPPGMIGFRVKLEDRVGNPTLVLRQGDRIPDPGVGAPSTDAYGNEGGLPSTDAHNTLVTVPNPVPGIYTLVVKGRASNGTYPDASFSIRLQEMLTPEINFDEAMNANGLVNAVSGVLDDNERNYFKFVIPASSEDQPVIGWQLKLVQSSGLASMRARLNALPSDAVTAGQMPFTTAQAILVPPFLTNGVWYVEVKGAGSTAFTLTSQPLQLDRPAWVMPGAGQTAAAPGVSAPFFGDTGVDAGGVPLPGDQSTFLQQGFLHYYGIEVPESNQGLLRAALEAFSGNPDLYLRAGAPPTLYHNNTGANGTIYDRSMLANATEYANWVPLAGKTETRLKPGLWYIAVRAAGNANARYRLKLSVGNVTELKLQAPELSSQLVAGGDWRYYRFTAPPSIPGGVSLTFSQQSGDVVVHVRDTVPPGNGATGAQGDLKDWNTDAKNHGPYPNFDAPGTYPLSAPPLRPGATYYVGVRAANDASFAIRVTTNAVPNALPEVIPFYGGRIQPVLAPASQSVYRIDVPAEATRWKHTSTNLAGVQMFIEQGTLPAKGSTDDWRNGTSTNSNFNQYLLTGWPWIPGQSYFLIVTNSTAEPQPILFSMDGKNAVTDDNDNDTLADAWELLYFGNTGSQQPTGDPDRDEVTNHEEYLEGTRPNDAASFRARLTTTSTNGTIVRNPDLPSYPLNSTVTLVGAPAPGYSFVAWFSDAAGRVNPLTLAMDGHREIGAIFKLSGDEYVTALPLAGSSVSAIASNVSMTKEPGEPNHAGNPGGKSIWWIWTAPASGPVKLSTAGSAFNTLLAVYTGSSVSTLTRIASDINSGGPTGRSLLQFNATAGTAYSIAVDGLNGASSRINLSLSMDGVVVNPSSVPPEIQSIARFSQGRVEVEIVAEPGRTYTLEATENLTTWQAVGSVRTDATGAAMFVDAEASPLRQRFYRAKE